ncbi:hypothetical protein CRG98_030323 [Punica granatum]|uniref:Uncharacterized protein n=1 Tax=Punica granatum TaxID=22663 RepID=A0A2I0J021_PUNGR|nr:hypothetical protein CRG98_030323 [Punica granatum]
MRQGVGARGSACWGIWEADVRAGRACRMCTGECAYAGECVWACGAGVHAAGHQACAGGRWEADMHAGHLDAGGARDAGECANGRLDGRGVELRASEMYGALERLSKCLERIAEHQGVRLSAWTRGPDTTDHGTNLKR